MSEDTSKTKRISEIVQKEWDAYRKPFSVHEVAGKSGITFDHYDTISRIKKYMNDEFYECSEPDAVFYPNLGKMKAPHIAKNIDLDTKEFELVAKGDIHSYASWVANRFLRRWSDEVDFAIDLDDLSDGTSDYGSMITKRVKRGNYYHIDECDLSNVFFDTSLPYIIDSPSFIEIHHLTESQIRKKYGSEKIKKIIKNADEYHDGTQEQTDIIKYEVWERWGDYSEDYGDNEREAKDPVYMHHIGVGQGDKEVILLEEEKDKENDFPYDDYHISKYRGRWLRVGTYERLFDLQEEALTLTNTNRETRKIASLLLLRSTDSGLVGKNLLQKAISGLVLDAADLEQVGIQNIYFQQYLAELAALDAMADKLCLTPEVITGERLPSDTTVRGQIISTNVANKSFTSTRNRIGKRLSNVLLRHILPHEVKKWNKEEAIKIAENDDDVRRYDMMLLPYYLREYRIHQLESIGSDPSQEQIEKFTQDLIERWNRDGRNLKFGKNFFDFKYGMTFNPTGENENKQTKNEAYRMAIDDFVGSQGAVLQLPLYREYLEYNGIKPFRLTSAEMQQFQQANTRTPQRAQESKPDKLLSAVNQSV